ncbi:MAG: BolA family transcriptional regulator [Pseudomonadota bacterium]|nr:MAG: BolA family transcriptional regulator [Pseudomonadota bacterium]
MDVTAIEQRILQAIPGAQVKVDTPDQVHYVARIVADEFAGRSRIERHRLVHAAIGPELGREIHALSLDLKSPDEARHQDG